MARDVELFSMYLLLIDTFFFIRELSVNFPFINWIAGWYFVLFAFRFFSSLYILAINPLSERKQTKVLKVLLKEKIDNI
jgi:hypothetical protein